MRFNASSDRTAEWATSVNLSTLRGPAEVEFPIAQHLPLMLPFGSAIGRGFVEVVEDVLKITSRQMQWQGV
jgi:hypothetical protein